MARNGGGEDEGEGGWAGIQPAAAARQTGELDPDKLLYRRQVAPRKVSRVAANSGVVVMGRGRNGRIVAACDCDCDSSLAGWLADAVVARRKDDRVW